MSSKLVMTMYTEEGEKNFSYNYADPEATTANVKALGQALVTNGAFFMNPPTDIKAAKIVTTTTSEYDINS